ncbi:MAG: hypothetical protein ACJAZO_001850 [Myxococcota bacterium]|jgi:hypothetical protein
MNEAPRIVRPAATEDLELLMEFEWNQVTVFARDDDNDALNFQWVAPLGAQTETSDGEDNSLQYSNFRVRRAPDLHGTQVTLAVDDGLEETFVEWTLIIPGAQ